VKIYDDGSIQEPFRLPALLGPVLVFSLHMAVVWYYAQNVPFWDDYDTILVSTLALHRTGDWLPFLFGPHVDHIIMPVRLLGELQWLLFGHIDFRWYIYLGNLSLFGLYLCWRATFPTLRERPLWHWMAALALFNFSYHEASTWATTAMSSLPVLVLAWASLLCLTRRTRGMFVLALASATAAALTHGIGLLLFAAGVLVLMPHRRWRALSVWLVMGTLLLAFDIFMRHYCAIDTGIPNASNLLLTRPHIVAAYGLAFVGAGLKTLPLAITAAVILLAGLAVAWWRVPAVRSPLLLSWTALLLLTVLAATWSRASMGIGTALSSRYALYGCMLLALWIGMLGTKLDELPGKPWHYLTAVLALAMTWMGVASYLENKTEMSQRFERNLAMEAVPRGCSVFAYPDQSHAAQTIAEALTEGLVRYKTIRACADVTARWQENWLPATRIEGDVNIIEIDGQAVHVIGWTKMPDGMNPRLIMINSATRPFAIDIHTEYRPDVSHALHDPSLRLSGYSLTLYYPSTEAASRALKSLCLGYNAPDGQRVVLPYRGPECMSGN
jgi:hypothetical protein